MNKSQVMPSCMPAPRGTHWMTRFGHLTSYGATYYGYLYDKVRKRAFLDHYTISQVVS